MIDTFARIASAYGLTDRQGSMLRAIVVTGGVRLAAEQLAIPYTSARNIVAELKAKLGVATVPMMIGLLVELASEEFGDYIPCKHGVIEA